MEEDEHSSVPTLGTGCEENEWDRVLSYKYSKRKNKGIIVVIQQQYWQKTLDPKS
jgi:hypothetical protein